MPVLAVQTVTLAGLTATYDPAGAGGDSFVNTGKEFLHVKNAGGSPVTVTADDQLSTAPAGSEAFDADTAITIAGGAEGFLGGFPTSRFTRDCLLTYDQTVTVTVAVVRALDV